MLRWICTLIFISTGLVALEANMFQQQTWNVAQQGDAKRKQFTFTPTPTSNPKAPTRTITQTPDPKFFTPTPTPTPGK